MVLKDPPAVPVSGWLVPGRCGPGGSREAPQPHGGGPGLPAAGCSDQQLTKATNSHLARLSLRLVSEEFVFPDSVQVCFIIHQKRS